MPWWITDGVLHRSNVIPAGHKILTKISRWGDVTIPEGVTRIEEQTFQDCCGMERVAIPDTVRYIGTEAFHACAELTHVLIPDGVEHISLPTMPPRAA